jgi:cytochrome c5
MIRVFILALSASVSATVLAATPASTAQQADAFVGAEACRDCHANFFQAWSATKHARALSKLSGSDRTGSQCVRCHVTDTAAMLAASESGPKLQNVQCEACHGAGRPHVEAARAGNPGAARTDPITERTCTRCHNEESPHYKTFIYTALVGLVHRVQ